MTRQRDRRCTTGRRAALVGLTAAVSLLVGAPLAAAAPPDHAQAAGKHAEEDAPVARDGEPSTTPDRGKRAEAPGQATTPGRSADAPGRATPPPEPVSPSEPSPAPRTAPDRGSTPDRGPAPDPASVAPAPPPDRPAPARVRTASAPAGASGGDRASAAANRPVATAAHAPEPVPPPAGDPWSAFDLLRGALRAAGDTAGTVGADVAGSVGSATSDAARRLTAGLGHTEPHAPRDLGVPMGVLLLFGGYLAVSRWLDRGALPMAISEGQGDHVQHVL